MDSHYTNINGIKLHYVTGGIENGPVCLLLHGFPESWIQTNLKALEITQINLWRVISQEY